MEEVARLFVTPNCSACTYVLEKLRGQPIDIFTVLFTKSFGAQNEYIVLDNLGRKKTTVMLPGVPALLHRKLLIVGTGAADHYLASQQS